MKPPKKKSGGQPPEKSTLKKAQTLIDAGATYEETAKAVGVVKATIQNWINRGWLKKRLVLKSVTGLNVTRKSKDRLKHMQDGENPESSGEEEGEESQGENPEPRRIILTGTPKNPEGTYEGIMIEEFRAMTVRLMTHLNTDKYLSGVMTGKTSGRDFAAVVNTIRAVMEDVRKYDLQNVSSGTGKSEALEQFKQHRKKIAESWNAILQAGNE